MVVWLNKVYQIDINTLTRLIRNVVVTCEISTYIFIRIWDPGSNHAGKATWQVSHLLLIDWSSELTRPKTRKPFRKVVSDISRIHDCSWICRKQFIICLHLISCPYSLTIFLMPKGITLTMWNLHMISWLQASHNPPYELSSFFPSYSK